MNRGTRAALVTAAVGATLAFAGGAFAANTGTVAVWHSPMALGASGSTTIHVKLPQTTDPVAAINIYVPSGYTANLSQAAGATIGSVDAAAFSHDANLTLPLSGAVTTDAPSNHTADSTACARTPTSAAVWILNLSVAGQAILLPLYVNPTTGAEQALGAYKLSICLPPPDVPIGTPGRSANGAQVLDAKFTVKGILTTPSSGATLRWETLFTPYNPGQGTVNALGTFEARSLISLPVSLGFGIKLTKRTGAYSLKGKLSEGGIPVAGSGVTILRGASAARLSRVSSASTKADGSWSSAGRVKPKKTTYFKAIATAAERDFTAQGCVNPLPVTVAPAGCVSATLPPWTATSTVVKLRS
ncbi:MAG: hypothetical protein ACXVRJ_07075 [Gaiellaceae bacterium]